MSKYKYWQSGTTQCCPWQEIDYDRCLGILASRARRPRRKSAYGDEVPVRAPRKLDMVGLQGALGFCLTCKPVWQLVLIKRPRPLVRWIGP